MATSFDLPDDNGSIERENHNVGYMLVIIVQKRHDYWNIHLPHVEFAYINAVAAATRLAPPAFPLPSSSTRTPEATKASTDTSWSTAHWPLRISDARTSW